MKTIKAGKIKSKVQLLHKRWRRLKEEGFHRIRRGDQSPGGGEGKFSEKVMLTAEASLRSHKNSKGEVKRKSNLMKKTNL